MSNVAINLLPDLRQAKQRERSRRQLAVGISVLIWAICAAVVILMVLYSAGQKVVINRHTNSIADKKNTLEGIEGLTDALTGAQHLAALPGLYDQRVYMTKFLEAYQQSDPADIIVSSLTVDAQNQMVVNGTGKAYASVAKLARGLEASNVTVGPGASVSNTPYFADVAITSVGNVAGKVTFTLNATLNSGVVSGSN